MSEPQRIVSLLASGTELVCALGLGERLVGRSHECDHPAWVRQLPQVSEPTFDIAGSSREIDERVRGKLRAGEPLYRVDEAKLLELAPDLLITQTHCEVCAVSPGDLAHGTPARLSRTPILSLTGGTLQTILASFVEVGDALGRPDAARQLARELTEKLAAVRTLTLSLDRPRVLCLEWIEPLFCMGNWGPELVECAGGESALGNAGQHSTTLSVEQVMAADADVLLVAPCGFGLERARDELPALLAQPAFAELRAVRAGRAYVADGNLYFNRSSPSLFDTPRLLAEILHPNVVAPIHRDRAWQPFPRA